MFLLRFGVLFVIIALTSADHFRGGTINWKPKTGKEVSNTI